MKRAALLKALVWVQITRPLNLAVAVLTVSVGYHLGGGRAGQGGDWPWLALAAALAAAAGNVINDVYDLEIDRVNKPRRPLPSGRLSLVEARLLYVLLLGALVPVALRLPPAARVFLGVWVVALHLYGSIFKRELLVGNLLVSLVCSSGFVLGSWVAGEPRSGLVPAGLAFLFLMGREIVKDAEDVVGDRSAGARTLSAILGPERSAVLAVLLFLLFILAVPIPYLTHLYGPAYLLVLGVGVVPVLLYSSWILFRTRTTRNLRRVSWILKFDMFVGILAFYLGPRI
jgi:geranylgeranylglycerol-phosphate geranylgeranyltransferase